MAGPGGRMMAGGAPTDRSMDFKGSSKRLLKRFATEKASLYGMLAACVLSVGLSVVGPKILGKATDLVFAGVIGRMDARGHDEGAGRRGPAQDQQRSGRPALRGRLHPGPRHRLRCGGQRTADGAGGLRRCRSADAGGHPAVDPDHQPGRVPAARGHPDEAVAAAAVVLRPGQARRGAQPGDERHRQHLSDDAADDGPAHQLPAHHRRRAGHDVLDLAAAGPGRSGDGAAVGGRGDEGRQAVAAAVRAAVEGDGQAQRPYRGDVHRAHPGEGLRAAGGVREGLRRAERRTVRGELPGAVQQRDHAAADDVRVEPELCADSRRRWAAGRVGCAVDR